MQMSAGHPDDQVREAFELDESATPDGAAVLRVHGELDMATVEGFEPVLRRAIGSGDGPVVVDFAECRFVDSMGVRTLIRAGRLLAERGRVLRVVGAHDQVRELFRMIALDQAQAIEFDDGR